MRQASRRKYHYIYKITRYDGHYYIGMHSTDNLDDDWIDLSHFQGCSEVPNPGNIQFVPK